MGELWIQYESHVERLACFIVHISTRFPRSELDDLSWSRFRIVQDVQSRQRASWVLFYTWFVLIVSSCRLHNWDPSDDVWTHCDFDLVENQWKLSFTLDIFLMSISPYRWQTKEVHYQEILHLQLAAEGHTMLSKLRKIYLVLVILM